MGEPIREPRRAHRPRGKPSIAKIGRGLPTQRCDEAPSPEFLRGIKEFNRREFFECHETLEALWIEETDPLRYLYQGILQVGVGFYHLRRGNYKGALSLLQRGLRLLQPFARGCLGVDVARLESEAHACRQRLLVLGPERFPEFDEALIPRVLFKESAEGESAALAT